MVLLQHELADGTRHFDWMVQRFTPGLEGAAAPLDPESRDLITFRVMDRVDLKKTAFFAAEHTADHRNAYLDFAGDLSGGRGTVRKIARGIVRRVEEMPGAICIRGKFSGSPDYIWAGVEKNGGWEFQRSTAVDNGKPAPRDQAGGLSEEESIWNTSGNGGLAGLAWGLW